METAEFQTWKPSPRWLYWVAAPLAPAFIAMGALLCLGLSLFLGQEPLSPLEIRRMRERDLNR